LESTLGMDAPPRSHIWLRLFVLARVSIVR